MISCTMTSNYDEQFYPEILLYNDKSDFKLYRVPVFDNFNFSINYPNILFIDVKSKIFKTQCIYSHENNLNKYRFDIKTIKERNNLLFNSNIFEKSNNNFDILDPITNDFMMRSLKLGTACLMDLENSCETIFELTNEFRTNNALTKNTSDSTPETYYLTNNRILRPLLTAYSYASQKIGRPDDDIKNKQWFLKAIYQNTFDPRPNQINRERDFERSALGDCNKDLRTAVGQNHHTQSGLIYEMYGVLWNIPEYAAIGLDAANAALKSVDEKGALVCDAARGANAIAYQGFNLSNIVSILTIANNQKNNINKLPEINSLHRAVKFQLDLLYDKTQIYSYSKRMVASLCSNNYKEQCFHSDGLRHAAFGWVIPYQKLFPQHENSKKIKKIFRQIINDKIEDNELKRNLNAFAKGRIPTYLFKKNMIYEFQSDWDDQTRFIYDDLSHATNGSPICMYGFPEY